MCPWPVRMDRFLLSVFGGENSTIVQERLVRSLMEGKSQGEGKCWFRLVKFSKRNLSFEKDSWSLSFHVLTSSGAVERWSAKGRLFPLVVEFLDREVLFPDGAFHSGEFTGSLFYGTAAQVMDRGGAFQLFDSLLCKGGPDGAGPSAKGKVFSGCRLSRAILTQVSAGKGWDRRTGKLGRCRAAQVGAIGWRRSVAGPAWPGRLRR
jgi:hypothetical protein